MDGSSRAATPGQPRLAAAATPARAALAARSASGAAVVVAPSLSASPSASSSLKALPSTASPLPLPGAWAACSWRWRSTRAMLRRKASTSVKPAGENEDGGEAGWWVGRDGSDAQMGNALDHRPRRSQQEDRGMPRDAEGRRHWRGSPPACRPLSARTTCRVHFQLAQLSHRLLVLQSQQGAAAAQQAAALQERWVGESDRVGWREGDSERSSFTAPDSPLPLPACHAADLVRLKPKSSATPSAPHQPFTTHQPPSQPFTSPEPPQCRGPREPPAACVRQGWEEPPAFRCLVVQSATVRLASTQPGAAFYTTHTGPCSIHSKQLHT